MTTVQTETTPGTFERGFIEPPLRSVSVQHAKTPKVRGLVAWEMGECRVTRFRDSDGLHLVISHPGRYPSWDEIKSARYRLLPDDATFALILPTRSKYVDNPFSPNVFELTEVMRDDPVSRGRA